MNPFGYMHRRVKQFLAQLRRFIESKVWRRLEHWMWYKPRNALRKMLPLNAKKHRSVNGEKTASLLLLLLHPLPLIFFHFQDCVKNVWIMLCCAVWQSLANCCLTCVLIQVCWFDRYGLVKAGWYRIRADDLRCKLLEIECFSKFVAFLAKSLNRFVFLASSSLQGTCHTIIYNNNII